MGTIVRAPVAAARKRYDLIIIGGGIYGAMLSFSAVKRGLTPLLLEKADFGGGTSFNSLRILHGGLRYLQTIDLFRFRESVAERRWFMENFPGLVRPLPCLMPLYGKGLKRPAVFRPVLGLNDLLSRDRNRGLLSNLRLKRGEVIDKKRTGKIFPGVDPKGLVGGAVWYDGFMTASHRLLIEALRFSAGRGAAALNYVEAKALLMEKKRVAGVMGSDLETGRLADYRGEVVVNAAGPWAREVAAGFDCDIPLLFRKSLAWNLLLDRKKLSDHGLAVSPPGKNGQTLFLVPWKGRILAGTGHAPLGEGEHPGLPTDAQIKTFLDHLNLAVPGLCAEPNEILHVFPGILPARRAETVELSSREKIHDHGKNHGPRGLYSISGVKFTTARRVAEKTLDRIFGKPRQEEERDYIPHHKRRKEDPRALVNEEAVVHLDDLMFRRTDLWYPTCGLESRAKALCRLFPWDGTRSDHEVQRVIRGYRAGGY